MKEILNNNELLRDLTEDILSDEELSQLCGRTVRTAHRRRAFGAVRVASTAIAILICATCLLLPKQNPSAQRASVSPGPSEKSSLILKSATFAGVIKSDPPIASRPWFDSLQKVPVLTTPNTPAYTKISDEQLFQLFPGRPLALVKLPSGGAELEFLDQ